MSHLTAALAALASLAALATTLASLAAKHVTHGRIGVASYGPADTVYTTETGLGHRFYSVGYSAYRLVGGL
jgi:hypothetical protein